MIGFLKEGKTLHGITMGMTLGELYAILGTPSMVMGDKEYGYVNYGPYRYGYSQNRITEMAIEFKYIEKPIKLKNVVYNQYDISLIEDFKFKSTTKLHKVIAFINHLQLQWRAENGNDKDHFILKIKGGPYVIANLYDGTIDKITIVDGHQND